MKLGILIVFLLFLLSVVAQSSEVYVLNVHYDQGTLAITDVVQKTGFFPDRKLQPQTGHQLDIISIDDEILYSFTFDVPEKIFTDGAVNGEITGGVVALNETDFALVVPYFSDAREIRITGLQNNVVQYTVGPTFSPQNRTVFSIVGVLVLISGTIIYYKRQQK